jgi:ribosomal protein S19
MSVFRIHKGSLFRYLIGNKFLIGYKLGQFCFTRKPFNFIKKNKQKR